MDIQSKKFYSMSVADTVTFLASDQNLGLSYDEAKRRLSLYGKNSLNISKRAPRLKIFLSQLKSPLILVLIIAGIITTLISHYRDSIFIFTAVIVNSILGFYQENKAEQALSELKTYIKQRSRVIRFGKEKEIDADDLVPGDVVRLSQGDRAPADIRIIFTNDFQVDEAILTGESLPVIKSGEPTKEDSLLPDQVSMVFAGTLITQGTATGVVCRTGLATEFGKISSLIAESEGEKTPLQKAIIKFSINSSIILSFLTIVVFFIGIFSGYSPLHMFLTSVAIAVSAIPEGLPVSMTVILAVGVERMAKRKGVVRKLIAAEALGGTTVILTDKTGTLTLADMVLSQTVPTRLDQKGLIARALINANVLIENPEDDPKIWRMNGRIMEKAIVKSAGQRGFSVEEIMRKEDVLQSLPFNASNKFSVSLIKESDKHILVFFGAADILIQHSKMEEGEKVALLEKINNLAFSGERVLGVATKHVNYTSRFSLVEDPSLSDLTFEGMLTFRDPIRPGVGQAIKRVESAGVKTVILTGDHKGTAVSVAKEIGFIIKEDSVLDVSEIQKMSEEELLKIIPHISVVSRVTPFDKLRIIKIFQKLGEVVAMTGDGVNDAPSIKQANVGIAMGSGTEVAQSVSDLVLLDDNFETIVAAIEEGRQILGNLRKVLVYLLSNVTDGLILIGGSLVFGIPLPLNPLQILWVNFFTDSFPAISYAFEKDGDSLSHKPMNTKSGLFDPLMRFLILVIGLSTSLLLFVIYIVLLKMEYDETLVRTFIFATFGTYTLLLALSVRSLQKSIFSYGLFSNKYLTVGIAIGFILMTVSIYHPFFQKLFETVALPWQWVIGVFLVGVLNIVLIEIAKKMNFNTFSRKTT